MAVSTKNRKLVLAKYTRGAVLSIEDALKSAKDLAFAKFVESIDIALNLGVDPRHADQNVRGAATLPKGLGKSIRVAVFAKGEKVVAAKEAGADIVGAEDLAEKINGGWLEFDQVIATPDTMGIVGKLGRVLGPRGLMPNPKQGTVTFDVAKAITEAKSGKASFRVDKAGIVHCAVGNVGMSAADLSDNIKSVVESILKLRPSAAKGTYLKRLTVSSTMGPGINVDLSTFRT